MPRQFTSKYIARVSQVNAFLPCSPSSNQPSIFKSAYRNRDSVPTFCEEYTRKWNVLEKAMKYLTVFLIGRPNSTFLWIFQYSSNMQRGRQHIHSEKATGKSGSLRHARTPFVERGMMFFGFKSVTVRLHRAHSCVDLRHSPRAMPVSRSGYLKQLNSKISMQKCAKNCFFFLVRLPTMSYACCTERLNIKGKKRRVQKGAMIAFLLNGHWHFPSKRVTRT